MPYKMSDADTPDCLICWSPIQGRPWYPQLDCACAPSVHRKCWQQWIAHGGNRCLFCRDTAAAVAAEPRQPLILIFFHHDPRSVSIAFAFATILFIYYCFLLVFYPPSAPTLTYDSRTTPPPWTPRIRDEL